MAYSEYEYGKLKGTVNVATIQLTLNQSKDEGIFKIDDLFVRLNIEMNYFV